MMAFEYKSVYIQLKKESLLGSCENKLIMRIFSYLDELGLLLFHRSIQQHSQQTKLMAVDFPDLCHSRCSDFISQVSN